MENKDFIESGLLESYLLGLSTDEEKRYISQKLLEDEKLSDYIIDLEAGIKRYFDQNSTFPPAELREIVHLRNTKTNFRKQKHIFNRDSKEESKNRKEYLDIEVDDTHIKVHKNWRPAFIAIFVLSKIFLIAGLYYYFKTTNLQQEIIRLKTEIQQTK